ncbi:sugar ABC transporter substrate-binding protein [Catenuloplanes atrovinosus]|uniref:N,N'-diacetylchitobiose transport system substrate-binding protein n=1 Tax=Catenuloplanes atrovinosus TaxID=137266 RepID=A0AAE4CDM0_9ACTN|nr:sugar ABC transporter substrate-binding protein [Catenuloplanes atrovinosus]MDR7279194.1 N,N'-diacetylchitobiose transport system substrate-binding protein [Catenuloplanes atrovinosus]
MTPTLTRRRALGAALAAVALGTTAACGGPAAEDGPVTLDVWLMKDSAPDAVLQQVNAEFQAAHPGVTVDVEILEWDGRDVKWKTALASDTPPDVLEMGNTDVLAYAASGGLTDLTGREFENQATWLQGLREAGSYEDRLYGVPYYGGDRVVIYRKDLWAKAGLTTPPATLAELRTAGEKLQAAHGGDFSGLYFPGRYQYAALPFLYDTGGAIAVRDGDTWTATLSTPQAQAGLTNWAELIRAVSRAPADADETNLSDVLAEGRTGMIIGQAWMVGSIGKENPELADQLAAFPVPGTAGPMPVFLGGSNLTVAAASPHQDLAYDWIKLMTGTRYQTLLAQGGLLPNSTSLSGVVTGITKIQMDAAARSWFTPTSTKWSDVDNAQVLMDMLQSIAAGDATVAEATRRADDQINQLLNAA